MNEEVVNYTHVEAHQCPNCGEYEEIVFNITTDGNYIDVTKANEPEDVDF